MIASKVHRGPRWLSFMASIFGASKGMASSCFACSTRSFSSTNKNSACGSMNRLISHGQATRSTLMSLRVIHFISTSWSPRICELNGEAVFVKLSWVDSCEAGELLSRGVDHVEIAIGTIVPSQSDIGACCLCVGSINLKNRRQREEPGKRVVGLQGAEQNGEVAVGQRQAKTVPLWTGTEGQSFVRAIAGTHPEFVQSSVVIAPETLEETHRQSAIFRGPVGELVPRPVVHAHRNVDVLVDVKGQREPLGKHVHDVIVRVRTIVKRGPEGGLPFLRLDRMVCVWGVKDEALELKFPDTPKLGTSLEGGVRKIADAVR